MKKIMFNDRYGLTEAVLSGSKIMTRRICKEQYWSFSDLVNANENESFIFERPKYEIGEIVAVAQSYEDAGVKYIPCEDDEFGSYEFPAEQTNGWTNKMFVRADLMPHQIRIINVRVERLQSISDEDCKKEGVTSWSVHGRRYYGFFDYAKKEFSRHYTPLKAYAELIDRISGKGIWERNPFVFVSDFELIK